MSRPTNDDGKPRVYVVEVEGRVVAAVSAISRREARELRSEEWFLSDLATRKDVNGKALWDGKAPRVFRIAEPIDVARYKSALSEAERRGEHTEGDLFVAFF